MTDVGLRALGEAQDDVVSCWQLAALGWTRDRIAHATAGLLRLHDGVFLTCFAPPTRRQLWRAATLTAPDSILSGACAGAHWGFFVDPGRFQVVTRPGSRGPQRFGALLVRYSRTIGRDTVVHEGLRVTSPCRTLVDLSPSVSDPSRRKAVRDALRQRLTSVDELAAACHRHRGRRGIAALRLLLEPYARLPLDRCRSDAEAAGLEILDAARRPMPRVNERHAGFEADYCWPEHHLIVELDGPQFHRDKREDARRTRAWTSAGFTVRRLSTDDVFAHPERLLAFAPRSNVRRSGS